MRVRLLVLPVMVALVLLALPASATSYYDPTLAAQQGLCWNGSAYVSCGGIDTQYSYGGTSGGDLSVSTTCRASYNDPSTWCFAPVAYVCDSSGNNCTRACVRTISQSGGCSCDKSFSIHGSCWMNS